MGIFRKLDLKPSDDMISELKQFRIRIDSDYKWGRGWTENEERKFCDTVYPKLEEAGFKIEISDNKGCDKIKGSTKNTELFMGEKYPYVYLHPMEFTGYATHEDIQKIFAILYDISKESDCIYDVQLSCERDVYALSDNGYEKFLDEHMEEIAECIMDNRKNILDYDIGFEFARDCRIPRVGDGSGYSSSDTDVKYIENLNKVLKTIAEPLRDELLGLKESMGLLKDNNDKDNNILKLTETGKKNVENYIVELSAKRKEILEAGLDTADETTLPTVDDILCDINDLGVNEEGEYFNGWSVTDHYDADYPLLLKLGRDLEDMDKEKDYNPLPKDVTVNLDVDALLYIYDEDNKIRDMLDEAITIQGDGRFDLQQYPTITLDTLLFAQYLKDQGVETSLSEFFDSYATEDTANLIKWLEVKHPLFDIKAHMDVTPDNQELYDGLLKDVEEAYEEEKQGEER